MSGKVWISGILSNYALSIDQGIRDKYYGYEWGAAQIDHVGGYQPSPDILLKTSLRSTSGHPLQRSDFPEASAVWDEKRYAKVNDFLRIGPFYAVRGRVANVLSRFDLGDGGLVSYTIYKADLVTPMEEQFFLLNFGARKDTILPELSKCVTRGVIQAATGRQLWKVESWHEDGDVALSSAALEGPDLWFEEIVPYGSIFMSDTLAQALIEIGAKDLFALKECRIAEAGQ